MGCVLQDEVAGLEVQAEDGVWHGVLPQKGTLVINVGDMAQVSSGAYRAESGI